MPALRVHSRLTRKRIVLNTEQGLRRELPEPQQSPLRISTSEDCAAAATLPSEPYVDIWSRKRTAPPHDSDRSSKRLSIDQQDIAPGEPGSGSLLQSHANSLIRQSEEVGELLRQRQIAVEINGLPAAPAEALREIMTQALHSANRHGLYGIALRWEMLRHEIMRLLDTDWAIYIGQSVYYWYLHVYRCPICQQPCDDSRQSIQCDQCHQWYHPGCLGISDTAFQELETTEGEWHCKHCDPTCCSMPMDPYKV